MGQRKNYLYLLVGLLIPMLANTAFGYLEPRLALVVSELSFAAALGIAMWTLVPGGRWFTVNAGLAVAGTGLALAAVTYDHEMLRIGYLVVFLVFFMIIGIIALGDLLGGGTVDLNRLAGAVCIYMLMGVVWADLYMIVEEDIVRPIPVV